MKILHISTFERAGGAAIAAHRLHQGLLQLGHDSRMLVRDAESEAADRIVSFDVAAARKLSDPLLEELFYTAYDRVRQATGRLFSTDAPTFDVLQLPWVREADVVNVHWASGFLSTPAMRAIQEAGKPVVWTLHDQNAFTGGCHYSGGCDQFTTDCSACPYVETAIRPIPALTLAQKRRWLDTSRLHVVTPSEWLAGCARRSAVLRGADVRAIANAVPVAAFQRLSRADARQRLALPEHATVLLIGADRMDEPRKGHAHVAEALRRLADHPELRARFAERSLVCAAFGEGALFEGPIPVIRLGRLSGDEAVAAAYRAADLFVLPTLEDNLPNTLLESLAAGTPVVAYATGGVVDVLGGGNCGVMVRTGDVAGLARALADLIRDDSRRARMSEACRAQAKGRYDLRVQAGAYADLYRELSSQPLPAGGIAPHAAAVAESERAALSRVTGDPSLNRALLGMFHGELAARQELIAARGGEIAALKHRVDALEQAARTQPAAAAVAPSSALPATAAGFSDPFEWLLAAHAAAPATSSPFGEPAVPGRVSVIVPVYNTVGFLEQTVRSVWAQTLPADRIEIVIVDDGSKDGSYELALRLQAESPVAMQVLTHPGRANRGVSATRNRALASATGELIALLDADDLYLPERLERGVAYMAAHPECASLCSLGDNVNEHGAVAVGANGTTVAGEYRSLSEALQPPFTFDQLWQTYPVANSSLLMRRSAIEAAGGYAAAMAHQAEDLLLVLKLSLQSPVHCLDEKLIQYRHHGASYTTQYHANAFESGVRVEVLYYLVHWMVVQQPQHRDRGIALFRRNYPLLLSRSHAGRKAVDALIAMASTEQGIDPQAFLAARQRDLAELDALRTVVPAALRDARDARQEVRRLQQEVAALRAAREQNSAAAGRALEVVSRD